MKEYTGVYADDSLSLKQQQSCRLAKAVVVPFSGSFLTVFLHIRSCTGWNSVQLIIPCIIITGDLFSPLYGVDHSHVPDSASHKATRPSAPRLAFHASLRPACLGGSSTIAHIYRKYSYSIIKYIN